jgi:hypothetical protein
MEATTRIELVYTVLQADLLYSVYCYIKIHRYIL